MEQSGQDRPAGDKNAIGRAESNLMSYTRTTGDTHT